MQTRDETALPSREPPETPAPSQATGSSLSSTRLRWILIVCCVAQFMVILDLSIVNVALPSIQSSLTFSQAELQWVVDAYAITFAGFLMLGGRAADHFGQRRTFVVAFFVFALASLIGGAASNREMLIIARAVQGLGGALMAASSLAIITSSFPAGPERHRAIGLWGAMNGLGGAAGTLFGGLITQEISWRWVLLINPPIAVLAVLVALRVVADRRRAQGGPGFDLAGAVLLTVGQMVLVYGIVEAGVYGWGAAHALVPIVLGFVLLGAFTFVEARVATAPLVPFREITRPLANANLIVLLFSASLFPMWFVGSLYLQQVLGLSPLHTGLTFLPMALTIMVCARQAGKLVGRFGVRSVLGGGLLMMTVGMVLFARIAESGSAIGYIVLPGLLTAAGIGFSIVPSTIAATQGAKEGQAGLASGLVNTSRQVGGGLGLAVLITLATTLTTHEIGHNQGVDQALTDGFRLAYWIGAGLCASAALMTWLTLPRPAQPGVRGTGMVIGVATAVVLFVAVDLVAGNSHGAPIGAYTTKNSYSFVSAPGLHPPKVRAATATAAAAREPGYVFLTNFLDITRPPIQGQSGPLILDRSMQPVWFQPVPTKVVAANLSLQTYEGKPALAWWQGVVSSTGATESGEDIVVNQHYQTVARLKATNGWVVTLHEIVIRGDDAWVTANKNVPMNLSSYGGAYNGALIDSAVQEYNLKTGKLVRSWDALDHIPLAQSQASLPTNGFPWDAFHVNAIDVHNDGSFVVSMRNTWAVYGVSTGGQIQWQLGGRRSTYRFGPGAEFEWQHDAQLHPGGILTVFDDHCCQITGGGTYVSPTGLSRALVLKLNSATHEATLLAQYTRTDEFDADYMGNTQTLTNGNVFVGWGSVPGFSEYTSSGKLVLDADLPGPDLSYRAQVESWDGQPLYPPSGAVTHTGAQDTVYASWNGATRAAAWRVLGGSSASSLTPVATRTKSGFETAIPVPKGKTTFEVQALDASGRVIGTSASFR